MDRQTRANEWKSKISSLNSKFYIIEKGITRGQFGSIEETISPLSVIEAESGGWVKISELKNPPRDVLSRYIKVYLKEK